MSTITVLPAKFESKHHIGSNDIIFDRLISDAGKILITAIHAIKSCAPNWVIIQEDLRKRLSWGRDKMRSTMKELEHYGFLKVTQDRKPDAKREDRSNAKKGSFLQNSFNFSMDKEFKDECRTGKFTRGKKIQLSIQASQPSTCFPVTDNPATDNRALPMPDKPKPRIKVLNKAMPTHSNNSRAVKKEVPKSAKRIFKRSDDKEDVFQWLLGLEFGAKKLKLSEDTASFLAHAYSLSRLEDCYFHLEYQIRNGYRSTSPIGLFRKLLDKEFNTFGKNSQVNEEFARKAIAGLGWSTLIISEKHVYDRNNSSKDLSLNMPPEGFRTSLYGLHASCCNG